MRFDDIGKGAAVLGIALLTGCFKGPAPAAAGPAPVFKVLPPEATVTVGRTSAFTARIDASPVQSVAWSVAEPGGGSVDAAGLYRAPSAPGTYTVQGAYKSDPNLSAAAKVTVVALPAGAIAAAHPVLAGAPGQTARIEPVAGSHYAWTIAGGVITAGSDAPAVTFQAGSGPKVTLTCRVTNAAGDTLDSSLGIPVAAPVALTIAPAAVTLTAGRSMKFGYDLAGGTSLDAVWSLGEPGCGSLDGKGAYVAPEVPGLYTVRVTSVDDPTKAAVARVKVVPRPPEGLSVPESFLPGAPNLRAKAVDLPGMTYAWTIEGGTLTSGANAPAVTFQAGAGPSLTLHCRITNEAGDSYTAQKTINVLQ